MKNNRNVFVSRTCALLGPGTCNTSTAGRPQGAGGKLHASGQQRHVFGKSVIPRWRLAPRCSANVAPMPRTCLGFGGTFWREIRTDGPSRRAVESGPSWWCLLWPALLTTHEKIHDPGSDPPRATISIFGSHTSSCATPTTYRPNPATERPFQHEEGTPWPKFGESC